MNHPSRVEEHAWVTPLTKWEDQDTNAALRRSRYQALTGYLWFLSHFPSFFSLLVCMCHCFLLPSLLSFSASTFARPPLTTITHCTLHKRLNYTDAVLLLPTLPVRLIGLPSHCDCHLSFPISLPNSLS